MRLDAIENHRGHEIEIARLRQLDSVRFAIFSALKRARCCSGEARPDSRFCGSAGLAASEKSSFATTHRIQPLHLPAAAH